MKKESPESRAKPSGDEEGKGTITEQSSVEAIVYHIGKVCQIGGEDGQERVIG